MAKAAEPSQSDVRPGGPSTFCRRVGNRCGRAVAASSARGRGTGVGCKTAGAAEAATGVSRCCPAQAVACITESGTAPSISEGEAALLLLFFDYNGRYATVRHGTGAACGVYVSNRD